MEVDHWQESIQLSVKKQQMEFSELVTFTYRHSRCLSEVEVLID